ncbi:MAG: aldehyde dehydrogenase family protein, partial [Bifidobacteriaceae bacterium]|nr:aldehyde dehydrogenase family protein [Bifidobacteriaceae bacterium]
MSGGAAMTMADNVIDTRVLGHLIGGREVLGGSRRAPVYNPATGGVIAEVAIAGPDEVAQSVDAASEAARVWSNTPLGKRAAVMFRARELIVARSEELARLITLEHGKTLPDALGEVARGLENVEFCAGLGHHLKGEFAAEVAGGIDVHQLRQPLGVVACVTPFNFPAMVPLWMVTTAMAAGNAVVLK